MELNEMKNKLLLIQEIITIFKTNLNFIFCISPEYFIFNFFTICIF